MSEDSCKGARSNELLSRRDSRLLIVDVQERLTPLIPVADAMIANCRRLIQAAEILGVPVHATEQYPRGLGKTVPQLAELLGELPAKQLFSCVESLDWTASGAERDDRYKVVVAGIEAHVCILQTALDLISRGFRVYIPADAVASRSTIDWKIGLERMAFSGAVVTTSESVLFEWCETAAAPEFKSISKLIRET